MSKDPSPKADGLRAMREASRGHLQATPARIVDGATGAPIATEGAALRPKKLIPYAGKDRSVRASGGGIPYSKNPKPDGSPAPRQRVKRKRKTT